MSAPKFTPGEWHVNAVDSKRGRVVGDETTSEPFDRLTINGGNRTIATVYHRHDARLLAAAPDLYAALRALTDEAEHPGDGRAVQPFIDVARAALRKAEGGAT